MLHRLFIPSLVLGLFVVACGENSTVAQTHERGPLGKADAIGSCRDGAEDFCGVQSAGNCWCDTDCEQFGDCCADRVAVCEDLGLSVAAIESEATFDALAFTGDSGLVLGSSVKFLIDNRNPAQPVLHFMNANAPGAGDAARFHYNFARAVLPGFSESLNSFNDLTYDTNDKRYIAGTLQRYRLSEGQPTLYGIQFYPQDVINEGTVLQAVRTVETAVNIEDTRLAFVALGPQQTTTTVHDAIEALAVEDLTIDEVLGALTYIPMQLGEAWGYLRIFPTDHDLLTAADIPVFDELPLDLTVVAGSITKTVQDASSHINLKSKERGTPNMVLRDAGIDHPALRAFEGQPVHLVVKADGFEITPSTDEEVARKLAERLNKPWVELPTPPAAPVTSFRAMCPEAPEECLDLSSTFGGKASNLGFLIHPEVLGLASDAGSTSARLGYDIAPAGVGVPVDFYFRFVEHAPNHELRAALTELIAAEKAGTLSVVDRVAKLQRVQQLFYAAQMPPDLLASIVEQIQAAFPGGIESVKIRSSANAEDIPGFDGAGLYDSFRADLDKTDRPDGSCTLEVDDDGELKMKPRTVQCAVKGVYASLWNKRAIEERSYARLDHATSGMGLAIVRRYKEQDEIAANSVVVTRVMNSSGVYGYTFSSQVGNNVVTNPAPGTNSETIVAGFLPTVPPTFTVTRFAKPDPAAPSLTTTVLSDAQMRTMLDITQTVERAYCRAEPNYYEGSCDQVLFDPDKPKALDYELKLFHNGQFLCKQVREFHGR